MAEQNRDALLLRYFENRPLSEVAAQLGTSEEAAKKRVARALEKLKTFFARRGIVLSATGLGGMLSTNAVQAAPAGLASTAAAAALLETPLSTLALVTGTLKLMAWAKIKTAAYVGLACLVAGGGAALVVNSLILPHLSSSGRNTPTGDKVATKVAPGGASFGGNLWVVKPDGSLWGLGYNRPFDPIGDGTTNRHPYLVRIGVDSDWLDVAAGMAFAVALKRDGSLWTWGRNTIGSWSTGPPRRETVPDESGEFADLRGPHRRGRRTRPCIEVKRYAVGLGGKRQR